MATCQFVLKEAKTIRRGGRVEGGRVDILLTKAATITIYIVDELSTG